jgi:hypothetical protein
MGSSQSGPVFVIRLRAAPKVDAICALRAALKVLLRRFGLRAISVRAESDQPEWKAQDCVARAASAEVSARHFTLGERLA